MGVIGQMIEATRLRRRMHVTESMTQPGALPWTVLLPEGRYVKVTAVTKSEARARAKAELGGLKRLPPGTLVVAGKKGMV